MTRELAYELAARGIVTMEDLAEQSVDDIADIEELTEQQAGELIMQARAPWFAEEETKSKKKPNKIESTWHKSLYNNSQKS